ncbi:MAG: hypothetical protein ACXWLR_13105, partial [Myxococcales bacterium]
MRRIAVPAALALLIAGPLCFVRITDTDAGWHLALGRLIAHSGLPHQNALAWTARETPWYDTSWLWDFATWLGTARFGLIALQAIACATLAVVLAAVAWACAEETAWIAPAIALLLLPRVTVRPHLATWAAVACVLALCLRARDWRWRAACVPIIALAGNLHSGAAFASGVLGLFCAQELVRTRRVREAIVALAGVAALCANPGGLFDLRSLLWHLQVQHVVVIEEYLPPAPSKEPVFFAALPLAIWLGWRKRREQPALLAAAVLFGALGLKAVRMVYEFDIVAAPLLASGLAALRRFGTRGPALGALAAAAGCLLGGRLDRIATLDLRPDWEPRVLPVRAVAFAREQHLTGRLFNAYDQGGYVEWALPEVPAFVDGRVQCFPPSFFRQFYAATHSPGAFEQFLLGLDVEWGIAWRAPRWLSGRDLFSTAKWALVYWDDVNEIWLRRDVDRFARLIADAEYRRFRPHAAFIAQARAASG